ncbi:YmfQ family protein [Clostridium diolis]|uniref:YmfQ family protein n=1 Tax=Clostridium diolis TaxID=223919 RepID=UPI003AF9B730
MQYGISQYGLTQYAENTPTKEDLEKYFVDLTKYVPLFIWENNDIMQAIYKSQGDELGSLLYCLEDLQKQFYIDTATWGIDLWEEEYGITTNLNYSYEQRREVVKAKKRGQGTCTIALIKSVAEAFSGGEVNVIENTGHYTFTIQFVGVKGIPKNMQGLKNALDNIKPAHLLYDFKYTYTSWDYLESKNLSYNNAESIKWDDLEIYD